MFSNLATHFDVPAIECFDAQGNHIFISAYPKAPALYHIIVIMHMPFHCRNTHVERMKNVIGLASNVWETCQAVSSFLKQMFNFWARRSLIGSRFTLLHMCCLLPTWWWLDNNSLITILSFSSLTCFAAPDHPRILDNFSFHSHSFSLWDGLCKPAEEAWNNI